MSNLIVVKTALNEETAKKVSEYENQYIKNFQKLQKSAQYFLNKLRKISNDVLHIQKISQLVDEIIEFKQWMGQTNAFTQQALAAQLYFQQALDNFLNREIYLTYVFQDGSVRAADHITARKLYQKAKKDSKKQGLGRVKASTAQQLFNGKNTLIQDINYRIQYSAHTKNQIFQLAVARWESNKDELTKRYNISKNTFYWRLHDYHISGWTVPIPNRGWIAEGYAGAVINEDSSISNVYPQHSLAALSSLININNIPAAVQGDIIWTEDGNIQFAIKSGDFSTARIGQFINLAYNILQINADIVALTPQGLAAIIPKLISINPISQSMLTAIEKGSEQELQKLIQMYAN